MRLYTLIVGTTFDHKGDRIPLEVLEHAERMIEENFINMFGGFSRSELFGGWKGNDGKIVKERSLSYMVLSKDPKAKDQIEMIAQLAKVLLSQESVIALSQELATAEFI